ncbi:MAG: PTS sugar transporter subunit IIA [Synergistaceae bacterium]|jgi:lichenan operon transcriptional antiterminator|nr:PTS sugar transporter subunit IIA [Synergistaceae bacterium]
MKSNCINLIKALLDHGGSMTARHLASLLDVTERSVKNYVAEINSYESGLIASSRKGYSIDRPRAKAMLASNENPSPQTSRERVNYIITKLITNDTSGNKNVDLYQLVDELFISFESVKKDMAKVKKKLLEYDLVILSKDSRISISGEELDKRKLLSLILYEEFKNNIMSVSVIEREFPGYDLELLKSIIKTQCEKYHYFINEYALLSLVLDVVIGMDRMKKMRTFGSSRKEGKSFGIREQELSQEIALRIEQNFHISYSQHEFEELTIILISHLMKSDFAALNIDNIRDVVGSECVKIVDDIRDLLKNTFFIDTNNKDFLVKFTLHIKNLLVRLENGYTTKNPLLEHIKSSCPMIFELAVVVADRIKKITDYEITEGEIAYIALHIGSNLETQKPMRNIVSCIIYFPQYYDFSTKLNEKIKDIFGERLEIKTAVTSIEELIAAPKGDFVVSTLPVSDVASNCVMITPFLNEKDIENIGNKLAEIELRKKKARLKKNLMQISNPKFFYKNTDLKGKYAAIRFMVDIMEREGYVKPTFFGEVLKRENQASTAFGHISVPHSLKMDANKTGMFVLLNEKKPVQWDDNSVSIILLLAINADERELFYYVYDNLIVLLLEKTNAAKVTACNTYIEFIEAIVECFQ